MPRKYTCESCHTLGYRWEIEAPATITPEQVEKLIDALCDYTDEPSQESLDSLLQLEDDLLTLGYYIDDVKNTMPPIELLRTVKIWTNLVHGDRFTQSFEEVTK